MPDDYPPAPTGLVLTGDVAALQREVRVLRQLNARLHADSTRLRAALQAARLPHAVGCLHVTNPAYPCSCWAGPHNARIDAALNESPDPASAPLESPGAQADH